MTHYALHELSDDGRERFSRVFLALMAERLPGLSERLDDPDLLDWSRPWEIEPVVIDWHSPSIPTVEDLVLVWAETAQPEVENWLYGRTANRRF